MLQDVQMTRVGAWSLYGGVLLLIFTLGIPLSQSGHAANAEEEDHGELQADDRPSQNDEDLLRVGKRLWEQANCMGCHGWSGGGGGGYGGGASVRDSRLDRDEMIEIISCGRPGSGMPSHLRGAWDRETCFGETRDSIKEQNLDVQIPGRGHQLRERQIETLADYIIRFQQGQGEPTKKECERYWGEDSRQCARM